MEITVTGRHVDITPPLKDYANKRISRINKYTTSPIKAHVILSVEKYRHHAEVNVNVFGTIIHGTEVTEDMYSSIDKVVDKIEHQIKKHKDKLKSKKNVKTSQLEIERVDVDSDGDMGEPRIIKCDQFGTKPMSIDEAIMQLDMQNLDFFVFINSKKNNKLNVVYKRKDSNYGHIDPDF